MTQGPFDKPVVVGPSEYGGDAGLVQPREKGHKPTPRERLNMMTRLSGTESVDPVTGLEQPVPEE